MDSKIKDHIVYLLKQIEIECNSPTCISYEYDPTPTGEERLKTVDELVKSAIKHLEDGQ